MSAVEPKADRRLTEIVGIAETLRPAEFAARIAYWRRGGLPGGVPESSIRKSRSAPMPSLDRMDRELQRVQASYRKSLELAVRMLQLCQGLEREWLFPIEVAGPALAALASDDPDCVKCGLPARRLRSGLCGSCYQAAYRERTGT